MSCATSCGCVLPIGAITQYEKVDELPPDAASYGVNFWTDWSCGVDFPDGKDEAWAWKLDLTNHVGMAKIYWESYTQKDRLLIWVDKQLYLDTGCVGTSDDEPTVPFTRASSSRWQTQLYIPQGVKRMWLAVLPNCAGGSGTVWKVKVDCPDGNRNPNDRRILKAYRTFKPNEGNYEHIKQEWS